MSQIAAFARRWNDIWRTLTDSPPILRGAAPAEWLGQEHYGKTMGVMGAPMMVASALAPLATAAIWTATGDPAWMLTAVLGVALTSTAGF